MQLKRLLRIKKDHICNKMVEQLAEDNMELQILKVKSLSFRCRDRGFKSCLTLVFVFLCCVAMCR
jgi:hypothetical protein